MKHPQQLFIWLMIVLLAVTFMGCQQTQTKKTDNTPQKQQQTRKKVKKHSNHMVLAFTYPVVMVNGKKGRKTESGYEDWIEVSFPQNSTNRIVMKIVDSEGVEKTLTGQVKVFRYTKYSKPEGEPGEIVRINPENPEFQYNNVVNNGYGEFTIREHIDDPLKGEIKGAVLAQLILGNKKKRMTK